MATDFSLCLPHNCTCQFLWKVRYIQSWSPASVLFKLITRLCFREFSQCSVLKLLQTWYSCFLDGVRRRFHFRRHYTLFCVHDAHSDCSSNTLLLALGLQRRWRRKFFLTTKKIMVGNWFCSTNFLSLIPKLCRQLFAADRNLCSEYKSQNFQLDLKWLLFA